MNIDQDRKTVHIETPHDDIIIKLNAELNKTYLWYGSAEVQQALSSNQTLQDSNSAMAGKSAQISRFATKGGGAYSNLNRDLVDSLEADEKLLDKVKDSDLPAAMQGMSKEERANHVADMTNARKKIQAQIKSAVAEREKLVAAKRKEMAEADNDSTLGDAMSAAILRQLKSSGFKIKK